MGRIKVLLVGLPLFANRIREGFKSANSTVEIAQLNTYYSFKDKLKFPLEILRSKVVYSINGTIGKSMVVDTAMALNKKVVMHWVGSDVTTAISTFKSGNFKQKYIDHCVHWCEVGWIKDELKQIGIEAEIVNFAAYNIENNHTALPKSDRLSVLSYIPQNRSDFYGLSRLKQMAEACPEISFRVMGSKYEWPSLPNVEFLGWIKNSKVEVDKVHVCLRNTEHDGLSNFVLEALAMGRPVLYNNPLKACTYCENVSDYIAELKRLAADLAEGKLELNSRGIEFIRSEFSPEVIYKDLSDRFTSIANER